MNINGIINNNLTSINLENLLPIYLWININITSLINNDGKNHVVPIPNSVMVCITVHFIVSIEGLKNISNTIFTKQNIKYGINMDFTLLKSKLKKLYLYYLYNTIKHLIL